VEIDSPGIYDDFDEPDYYRERRLVYKKKAVEEVEGEENGQVEGMHVVLDLYHNKGAGKYIPKNR